MNILAQELNSILEGSVVPSLLSPLGRKMFFPKGIVSQSTEAKKHATLYNATVGMAYSGGQPIELDAMKKLMPGLVPVEAVAYAPTPGDNTLRSVWKKEILRKNPDVDGTTISEPLVVPGLTCGIAQIADLFIDKDDSIVIPDMYWGNYNLIFNEKREANIVSFSFFTDQGKLNIQGFEKAMRDGAVNKKIAVIVNFPNNPTGYSPSVQEANDLKAVFLKLAEEDYKILAITDDAYFGLFYEDDIYTQSIFAPLSQLHENILAVKVDGATKEHFVWGYRIGFVTFGSKGMTDDQYVALNKKLGGAVRGSISNSSRPAQSVLLKALQTEGYFEEKAKYEKELYERYQTVRKIVDRNNGSSPLKALPFNSGYFMSFEFVGGNAEELRQKLLMDRGIGTISIKERYLRVAYSSVDNQHLEDLYQQIYECADELVK